jgi:hypothetical protein
MARGTITQHAISRQGTFALTTVTADAVNNHAFDNSDGDVMILCQNGTASPVVLTFVTFATPDGLAVADLAVTVAAGADAIIGPFPKSLYNQADDTVYVNVDTTSASVALAAIKY